MNSHSFSEQADKSMAVFDCLEEAVSFIRRLYCQYAFKRLLYQPNICKIQIFMQNHEAKNMLFGICQSQKLSNKNVNLKSFI